MTKSILSKNFKKLRLFKSLNQTEFAELFNLKRSSIGAYEEGRAEPKLDVLIRISEHFKLPLDAIVKSELTVNQIARFDFPDEDFGDLKGLHDKIDLLARQLNVMNKRLDKMNAKEQ